jgi:hypothetical protein
MKPLSLLTWLISSPVLLAAPAITLQRHIPCNLFSPETPVSLPASLSGFTAGASGEASATMTPYLGQPVKKTFPVTIGADGKAALNLDFGALERGYYELDVAITAGGAPVKAERMSLGVADLTTRSAAQARAEGSRFGMKMFYLDKDHENPWMKEEFDEKEIVRGFSSLGMQWTRTDMHLKKRLPTLELVRDFPVNVVLKLEGFPDDCYDEARYGDKAKRKDWKKATVPLKEPYQKWLREEVRAFPKSQNVFEIGNEIWGGRMPAEEFAEWVRIVVPVLNEESPGCVIMVDPGTGEFMHRFLAAKGLEGVNALALHPYSFTPLPEHRTRAQIRNWRDVMRASTGQDYDIYVTEYGWPVAPKDKRGNSTTEPLQAQRTARQSLMLYAEDCKALIPHWMGDREQDVTEREHWFGHFRPNHQPRPVILALSTCAEMIDGGKFVGDLPYGPGIGAMLFEKDGKYTLALWAAEEERTAKVETGVEEVLQVNIDGGRKKLATPGGKTDLTVSGNVIYLQGVSPKLAAKVRKPDEELDETIWSKREGQVTLTTTDAQPVIDGALTEWTAAKPVELAATGDAKGTTAKAAWSRDADYFYGIVEVRQAQKDNESTFEWQLGTRPERQLDLGSMGIYDFTFAVNPNKGSLKITNDNMVKPVDVAAGKDFSSVRVAVKTTEGGWTAELAVPVKFLGGVKTGAPLSTQFQVVKDGKPRLAYGAEKTRLWPVLVTQ